MAIERDGKPYVGWSSHGLRRRPAVGLDLIDAEFPLPPDQIKEYLVQFRPYEEVEIPGIALKPRAGG